MSIKIVTSQNQTYDPISEGVWEADVTRMFEHKEFNRFDNKDREGIKFEFTITEGVERERKAYRFFTPYLTVKSNLSKLWKAVKGSEPTAEELASINDLSDLIGFLGAKPVRIIVKNVTSKKGTIYYTVSDFLKSNRTVGEFPFEAGIPEGMAKVDMAASSVPTTARAEVPLPPDPTQEKEDMRSIASEMENEEKVTKAAGKKVE